MYAVKTPWWLKRIYPSLIWSMPTHDQDIFLTFDDGPHETITPFVLDTLRQYNAKASFFCIGKNVANYKKVYKKILEDGHTIGNHTYSHLNGWKTSDEVYVKDVIKASKIIDSKLFRPPYGRMGGFQIQELKKVFNIIMWDVISGDFDIALSPQKCLENVISNTVPGSIIVFHDSAKAFPRLEYVLPKALQHFKERGYNCKAITG
jgi:peptidoglycan/xylan/chitin deacetylase (PgdA/CDA1 family)